MMIRRFKQFVTDNCLFNKNHSLLATVSGGVDSCVMLHLLALCHFKVTIAHCNFKLRGADSDGDEQFVRHLAAKYNMPFYSISFDTHNYATEHKLSIEMAARELRYNWFNQLVGELKIDFILTAHHLNDNIETMLLNLCRGTGINGITGIATINGNIVRPLLFATRAEIEEYAMLNKLEFRTDITNLSDEYQRNIIRHQIVPVLKQINPSFEERMGKNLKQINQAANIYNWYVTNAKTAITKQCGEQFIIDSKALLKQPFSTTILFECINNFGFNTTQAEAIMPIIGQKSGNVFFSATHKLLIDRNQIIIKPNNPKACVNMVCNNLSSLSQLGFSVQIVPIANFKLNKNKNVACFDFDKLTLPITIRNWQHGDYFFPLGMNRAKKLSDFFIDNKINLFDKEETLVLVSENKIAWVVGFRPDNRFKVDSTTKQVIIITTDEKK